jgi:PAS domain S-box-containing protein
MNLGFKIRDLLVGKDRIESRTEYKFILLRGQLGLLMGIMCLSYIIIDAIIGVSIFVPWYFAGLAISMLIIFLNRLKLYFISSLTLLLFANVLVYMFAIVDIPAGGVYFFFVPTAAAGLVLMNQFKKNLGLIFVGLSFALAALAYFGNYESPLPTPNREESYVFISFPINFTLGMVSNVLIILFIIKRNLESEEILISNQEKLEALARELEKSKNRFAMAVEGSKAGIYEWQIQTNEVYVSSRWKNLLGYENEDLDVTLELFLSLVHSEDIEKTSSSIQKAIEDGSIYQNELRMKIKDGTYRWFLDSGLAMKENGIPVVAVGAINDIHDKKIAEQQLIQKNEELEKINAELDRFVYSASHDMRAPLSTLLGLLELAKLSSDPEELSNYFKMMTNRIYTMEGFIKEVTDYSRNSRLTLQWEIIRIGTIIDELIQSFDFLAAESNIKFEIDFDPDLEIRTDPGRLKVILSNLIANSIKYHDPLKSERYVIISITQKEANYLICISDNGIGIMEKYREKIFEMFFRGTAISGGSGLGLYIVKETLDKLNGSITCSSEPGKGTTFKVGLPMEPITIEKVKQNGKTSH